jgi:YVTN family beta-propeller protein
MRPLRGVAALATVTVILACGRTPDDPEIDSTAATGVAIDATHPAGAVAATVPLDSRPFGARFSPVDRAYYVTRLDASALGRGTLPAMSFPVSVPVGSIPTNVTFNPAGTRAYVTNQFDGNVGIVNVATNTQVSTIPIAGAPFFALVNGTATRLYVSNNSNNVAVVNLGTNAVVTTIPMPGAPNGMALNKGGNRLYVSVPGAGAVVEVNTATNGVVRTFAIGGAPQDLASTQGELFVANEAGSLDVINLSSGLVTSSVPLPAGGFGLAISPDLAHVYVSQPGGFLTIMDRVSKAVVTTLTLGGTPRKVDFNKTGSLAIVANEAGWVDFIN